MLRFYRREQHFNASETVRDLIMGLSDGLTVPFALAAGLSEAVDSSIIVITACFAEMAAGSISMGLAGYLAAKSDAEHYALEQKRENEEVKKMPQQEAQEVQGIFEHYGLSTPQALALTRVLSKRPKDYVDFMMRFELHLEKPNPKRAIKSALTVAGAYTAGGMISLLPYLFMPSAKKALAISAFFTLLVLFIFGYIKGRFTSLHPVRSGLQMMLVTGVAAAVAFAVARLVA